MTQFALAIAKDSNPCLVPVAKHLDDFLLEIAKNLFPSSPINEIFFLDLNGKSIDQLMLDTQSVLVFSQFEQSELCHTISKIVPTVDELVFWYGSDYDDLDYVYDVSTLLSKLEVAVTESACEAYIHFKQVRPAEKHSM